MLKYKDIVWTDEPDTSIYDKEELDKLRADSLIQWCKDLEDEQAAIHKLNLKYYQFYSNRFLASFDWGDNRFTKASLEPVAATTDNVTIQIVDALLAEIGNSRPKAKPVLFGASWKKRNQAIKLDKFLYGEFIRTNAYEEAKSALLNAFICGFGAIRVDMDGSSKNAKICLTNIFPDDIIIDNTEYSATGKIYTIAWRRMLPARIVQATYGLTDEQIEVAKKTQYSLSYRKAAVDWIPLIEGIRKGSMESFARGFPAYRTGESIFRGANIAGQGIVNLAESAISDDKEWNPSVSDKELKNLLDAFTLVTGVPASVINKGVNYVQPLTDNIEE